ncbi:SseB family protein [Caulobacter sp. 17J65-9]|uniref:SseB family protein n=1 Tax=Caulobacter sp. 17J65-9 TaxID=2709382 RepID=UPI0013C9ED73|nr:SseB family protein [Caulobacter sp. 17J65-9]NEX91970.1 SseB family protein [Caulobacter sp. 17J65-9]
MDDAHLTFQPLNELEALMVAAHADPARKAAFRDALLAAPLCALTQAVVDGGRKLEPGDRVQLATAPQADGRAAIILFTAPARIGQVYPVGVSYIQGPGVEMLKLARDGAAMLNPGIPYGVLWTSGEIEALLAG